MSRVFGIVLFLGVLSAAHGSILSNFSTGAEGWMDEGVPPMPWSATGGNPGGMIFRSGVGVSSGTGDQFDAPPAFLGDLSSYAGQTLSFDVKYDLSSDVPVARTVLLVSFAGPTSCCPPTTGSAIDWLSTLDISGQWTHYSAILNSAFFAGDVATTLADVHQFSIGVEVLFQGNANWSAAAYLDNVNITGGETASSVPEPAAAFLILAPLAFMLWRCRAAKLPRRPFVIGAKTSHLNASGLPPS